LGDSIARGAPALPSLQEDTLVWFPRPCRQGSPDDPDISLFGMRRRHPSYRPQLLRLGIAGGRRLPDVLHRPGRGAHSASSV
jgi:hypothetical protein